MLIKHIVSISFLCLTNLVNGQDNSIDKPFENFDKLWEITRDRYCNFDLLEVDWEERYEFYRLKITDSTTNEDLFLICGDLLKELDDGHVWIIRKGGHEPEFIESGRPARFFSEFPTNEAALKFIAVNDSILAAHGFSKFKVVNPNEGQIGVLEYAFSDSLVFVKMNSMEGISDFKIKKAMYEIVDSLTSRKGLIIDIRLNGGGFDRKGYQFAKYLTASDKVAIYKHTRKPKTQLYTSLKEHVIKANSRLNYTGPIVLMTSDYTVSAADVFALALSNFQNVSIVGDSTAGFFSDVSTYTLPNRWKFSLSTQKYYSHEMINYERIGVPPDYLILNSMEACEKGEDPVLIKSLELLLTTPK